MMNLRKRQRASSVLGLSAGWQPLEGVVLRRTNGSAQVAATLNVTLALDLLTPIRNLSGAKFEITSSGGNRERVRGVPAV